MRVRIAFLHLHHEREPLRLAADARHATIQEHQREVLRLALAELVEAPRRPADVVERVGARRVGHVRRAEQAETFLGQRVEDVVLRREVAVDRRRAVVHLGGDVPHRDLGVAVGHEQLQRGVEDGAPGEVAGLLLAVGPAEESERADRCSRLL